jgi:hypothetical protein
LEQRRTGSRGEPGHFEVRGFRDSDLSDGAHISLLELSTARESLEEFAKCVQMREGEVVRLWTDNQVTMAVIAKMVSRSPALMAEVHRLRKTLRALGMTLAPQDIPFAIFCLRTVSRDIAGSGTGTLRCAVCQTPDGAGQRSRIGSSLGGTSSF